MDGADVAAGGRYDGAGAVAVNAGWVYWGTAGAVCGIVVEAAEPQPLKTSIPTRNKARTVTVNLFIGVLLRLFFSLMIYTLKGKKYYNPESRFIVLK